MMPGQEPYTKEELQQVYQIVSEVVRIEKLIPLDELEDYVMTSNEMLRVSVYLSLDKAEDNGYTFEDWSNDQIATNLITYDKSFEDIDPVRLYAPIQSWRDKQYGIS